MQIDYALILSAGLGTRMGEIGKITPKVLWPVFFKTMLELQIRYCQDLGIKKIYINTHFLHEEINTFLKHANLENSVTVLYENPLLDSGGAIHNLAIRPEINYKGTLLLVNGDQFLFFHKDFWSIAKSKIEKCRAVLFGIKVEKSSSYNETKTINDKLVEISKNVTRDRDYITYSGLGLLNLKGLRPQTGISRFFDTVVDFKNELVELVTPNTFEYWDFGTADIFAKNILKLKKANKRESEMGKFLSAHNAFDGNEDLFINVEKSSIDLEAHGQFATSCIHSKGIFQKV